MEWIWLDGIINSGRIMRNRNQLDRLETPVMNNVFVEIQDTSYQFKRKRNNHPEDLC